VQPSCSAAGAPGWKSTRTVPVAGPVGHGVGRLFPPVRQAVLVTSAVKEYPLPGATGISDGLIHTADGQTVGPTRRAGNAVAQDPTVAGEPRNPRRARCATCTRPAPRGSGAAV
jgi:hypothetical protein